MQNLDKKEVITFRKEIPPSNGTPGKIKERIKGDGTIEEMTVRFYQGQQKALRVYPYIDRGEKRPESILTFPDDGDQHLCGDDDNFKFPVVVSVENDEFIVIQYENTDSTNTMSLVVDVVIDYYGGKRRVI
jgi:hypothetical protein